MAVDGDHDPVGERAPQVTLELLRLKRLSEPVGEAIIVQVDADAPVVFHGQRG
jgi:hypothetical protein